MYKRQDVDSVKNNKELKHLLKERAVKLYEAKETEFPEPEQFRELERSIGTVKTHVHNIFQKVNVTKRSQLLKVYFEYQKDMPWK